MRIRLMFLILVSLAAAAQDVNEEMVVTLRNVKVHVLDKNGNPVKGLTAADFVVKEAGKQQKVTYFEEVGHLGGAGSADQPWPSTVDTSEQPSETDVKNNTSAAPGEARYTILFLQSGNMMKGAFKKAVPAMEHYVDRLMRVGEKVKIVHMDMAYKDLTPFTGDKQALKKAIAGIKYRGALRRELRNMDGTIHDRIHEWIRADPRVKDVFVTFVRRAVMEKARIKRRHYQNFYRNVLPLARVCEQINGDKSLFLISGGSFLETAAEYGQTSLEAERLGGYLNRADITVYTLLYPSHPPSSGNKELPTGRIVDGKLNEEETIWNQDYDPILFQRMLRLTSAFPPGQGGQNTMNTVLENKDQQETGPASAAETTGGLFRKSTIYRDMTEHLQNMRSLADHFYRIGYPVEEPGRNARLNIRLADKPRGWKVLYGKQLEAEQPFWELDPEDQALIAGSHLVYGKNFRNELDATSNYYLFSHGDKGVRVPVVASFPAWPFPIKGYEIDFLALSGNLDVLDFTSTILDRPPNTHKGKGTNLADFLARQAPICVYDVLLTEERPRFLRFYVRNLDTGKFFFDETEITSPPSDDLFSSDIVLSTLKADMVIGLNHMRKLFVKDLNDADKERVDMDPFWLKDRVFKPAPAYALQPEQPLWLFFHVKSSPKTLSRAKLVFWAETQGKMIPLSGEIVDMKRDKKNGTHVFTEIDIQSLAPGIYRVAVEVIDPDNHKSMAWAKPFDIKP